MRGNRTGSKAAAGTDSKPGRWRNPPETLTRLSGWQPAACYASAGAGRFVRQAQALVVLAFSLG